MKRYSSVEAYFSAQESWHAEQQLLRNILRACPLVEELRWGSPVYSHSGNNVVGIRGFKSYFGLWFFQGVLLRDKNRVLINAQEGKTKALRQWRMSSAEEIRPELIQSYVKEAIELAGQGKSIAIDRSPRPLEIPVELQSALKKNKRLAAAFEKLFLGCKREYATFVAEAKRPETRLRRVEKISQMIIDGQGLNDKYR
ncbi:MAG: YdeI/OmpD-associated family protein [Planctomycetales bacterium]|nr:YdeI/OmpD-associated family protein [Planctomycetales bacterium]